MKKIKRILLPLLFITSAVFSLFSQTAPDVKIGAAVVNGPDGGYIVSVEYDFPEGFHQTLQESVFNFEIIEPAGINIGAINYPEGVTEEGIVNYYGKTVLEAELLNFNPEEGSALRIKASWQLCNEDGMCLFPQSAEAEASAEYEVLPSVNRAGGFTASILFFLLLSFLGGLLLNVMPCVLPVLSIKALSLVKQGSENRRQILASSLLYTAGVILSLLALAAVIIIIKASGEQVGWGFQFQNRGFVIALLTIIFVFALSLFEVFTIAAPVMKTGGTPGKQRSSAGSHFFSGVMAVLLATPCTAPFLGTAAGFAFSQSAPVILGVFFMVGLGLAFPFILIGFFPAVVSKLPKPGSWMNTFREIMGFLLLGTAIWLLDVLSYQSDRGYFSSILIYLLAVTAAAWLYGKLSGPGASTRKRLAGLAAAVVIIAGSAAILLGGSADAGSADTDSGRLPDSTRGAGSQYDDWLEFSPETVYDNIGGEQPVFVAFGAKWCMTCRTNESTVLFTEEISRFFEENNVILIHGDYTNANPEITEWMKEFGRAGVPFYTWYPANSFDAVLLPEIINRKMITNLAE